MLAEQVTQGQTAVPRRGRRRVPWGFVIAAVAVAAAVLYLVLANTGASADYYMTIGQLRACHDCSSRAVRVAGVVQANTIQTNAATQVIHFTIQDTAGAMPVTYSGTVPDIFRAGIQVVVEGKLGTNGVFQANNLLAKCPSKFQSATPPPSNA
ncbi:MAG: cytochrome c maturation protein CcmE [Ktedonobacterales bacterium]